MIELYYYEGLWWYNTSKGAMCCPPFVRDWPDVKEFFAGEDVSAITFRRDEKTKVDYPDRGLKRNPCAQYDKNMKLVKVWPSVRAAALGTGLSTTSVRSCLSGKADFVKGITFRKVEDE